MVTWQLSLATGLHFWWPKLRHSKRTAERMKRDAGNKRQAGFSTLELLVVVAMSLIITAIAIPGFLKTSAYLRAVGDLRALNGLAAQAKMRAAADFTRARLFADLNGNTYQLQVWNKAGGCWVADGDVTNTCITYSQSAPSGTVIALSQGDTFDFGSLSSGPTPGQATIQQAGTCKKDNGNSPVNGSACILFSSRGVPIDPTSYAPISTDALYVKNANLGMVYAVTVSSSGSMQTWSSSATSANWHSQ
jgi:Tfp pilus assembly protein FimT